MSRASMHSVSDLTTFSRNTTGDVPPKLVGSSNTVVGNKMYLYGGRLVTERRMVTDMFIFDLNTLVWEKVPSAKDENTPDPRYFHSADAWDQYLIIFGGMGLKPDADNADDLCVLNDVRFYDLASKRWMPPSWSLKDTQESLIPVPKARYAHLSSVSGDRLFIIGGQDLNSVWLDDVYVYDLSARAWVQRRDYARHCGTYRSVAVSADQRVRLPHEELRQVSTPGPSKPVFGVDQSAPFSTSADNLVHLPYSADATDEFPNDIYLYSNYNFTDVQRELEVFTPLPNNDFNITDESSAMNGTSFPPGLRFPTGAILGTHLIIAGTYIAHNFQSFSVWALNLLDMTWSRVDPGGTLSTGSWFRSCLWADANKFLIFGNRQGNLVDDYNRRLLSWDDVAIIDLEAFGIYQPPRLEFDIRMQEMGLAALEEGVLADFEIVCDDDRRVQCSRKVLEDRWPWFKEQRRLFLQAAAQALDALPLSSTHVPLPEVPGTATGQEPRPDPRLSPRVLHLSEPYPITLALVQYFYSLALLTPLQHAPAVLSALLVLATNYDLPHLRSLVKHAMHRALSNSTSVGVYEVATLCSCRSLQIRALKTVMLYNQKRPAARSRQGKDSGGGSGSGRPSDTSGPGSGAGGGTEPSTTARPRGMSDALMRPTQSSSGGAGPKGHAAQDGPDESAYSPSGTGHAFRTLARRMLQERTLSIISSIHDHELTAVAELHTPVMAVDGLSLIAQRDQYVAPLEEHYDALPLEVSTPIEHFSKPITSYGLHVDTHTGYVPSSSWMSPLSTGTGYESDQYDDSPSSGYPSHSSFHLPRPRTNYRDTDTPSLTSSASRSSLNSGYGLSATSASSFLSSPPASPAANALVHTIDPRIQTQLPHLAVINELHPDEHRYRSDEDSYRPNEDRYRRLSWESKMPLTFAAVDNGAQAKYYNGSTPTTTPQTVSWRNMPNLEALRLNSKSPVETVTDMMPQHTSSGFSDHDTDTRSLSSLSSPQSHSHLSRFFTNKSEKAGKVVAAATVGSEKQQRKAEKAEAKKRKKAEARAKAEKLALDLKTRSLDRAMKAEQSSVYTSKSQELRQKRAAWEEDGCMFGGLGGF